MKLLKKFLFQNIKSAGKMGFFHLLSANLLIQITGFGGQIFLTRILDVEDIGAIKVMQSYLNVFVIIASLGLNTAVLKLCSENNIKEEKINTFNISFIFTIIASLVLVLLVELCSVENMLKTNEMLNIYILLIPFLSMTNLIVVYFQSQQNIKKMSLIQSYSKIIIVVFSTLLAYLLGLKGYIYSLVVLNAITFFIIIPFIKKEINNLFKVKFSKLQVKRIFSIGLYAFGANLLGVLLLNINLIVANTIISNSKSIGYYSIAQLIISTMMMIPSTLGQIMVPKISKVSHNKEDVLNILKNYQRKNSIIAICLAISAGITAPFIIPIVFGKDYSSAVEYFEILLVGFVFWSLYSPKGIALMGVGRSDINFYISIFSLTINIILSVIFMKIYGMYGAALATTIMYFFTVIVNNIFFRRMYIKNKI
ncbi:glycosyltransferase [Priestia megaterium]|uniref:oligosaccharide flippase family protein n=1 Tax=Priestia megaterium TaxID=1404 RepID=UPI000BF25131|nr:oligosaccharide flippase family protein [Priestia megaterium]PET70546.1 glycosyltransferase [Priestia megaterium]PFK85980.1 glycosyltransferase [Priestia megaterium]PGN66491.1 glycosyltransferase [Priestia megaterium]